MKIQHYITFDRGAGPVSFIEAHTDDGVKMIRITHNARFEQVKEVDAVETRRAIDSAPNLGEATTKVLPHYMHKITQETLGWAVKYGCTSQSLRWLEDGSAVHFKNEADAIAWGETNKIEPEQVKRRKRIMG